MSAANVFIHADSYKLGMWAMYPDDTSEVYSFIESRGGMFDKIVTMGAHHFVKDYLCKPLNRNDIDRIARVCAARNEPFNREKFQEIIDQTNGYIPVIIKSVPEGTVLKSGMPFVTIKNTLPSAYWVTTIVETVLLSYVWSMTSVATLVANMKKVIKNYQYTSPNHNIDYMLHNFGDRGAKIGFAGYAGVAHLLSFNGTDCTRATEYIMDNYPDYDTYGVSVPASEHSISTSFGRDGSEKAYVLKMMKLFDKYDIVSVVGDTYNIFNFTKFVVTDQDIKSLLIELGKTGKKLVIRPDSGEASDVLEAMLSIIDEHYGSYKNDAGYKVINPGLGLIWGDGINLDTLDEIYANLARLGWSFENLTTGCGGYITDFMMRDDLKFAMKASNVFINGKSVPICKDPITAAWKKSKMGKFSLIRGDDGVITVINGENYPGDILETIYENGWAKEFQYFSDSKANASLY